MKFKLFATVMIIASFYSKHVVAQKKHMLISGTVISAEESLPLEGVLITEKGTKNFTGTMPDGQFALSVDFADTIVLRFDDYETKEIKITEETYYQITLKHKNDSQKLSAKKNN